MNEDDCYAFYTDECGCQNCQDERQYQAEMEYESLFEEEL